MKRIFVLLLFCPVFVFAKTEPHKVFTTTPVYDSIIATYSSLALKYPLMCKLEEKGKTDIGKPLHLFIIDKDGKFTPEYALMKTILLINNGIHPGEPDGIDASIQMAKDLLAKPENIPSNVIILIIPVYNIDGCLNRGSYSRVNQDGPDAYGFRANAKNLDLNRDFIKADAQNTFSFEKIFTDWHPDIFVDTHVSDGADYKYVMTLIETQRNKLDPWTSGLMQSHITPALYTAMKAKNYEMCPYVESHGASPETGIDGFLETPRFSTGYAALFGCISYVTETHMLKPYNDRVWATYEFLNAIVKIGSDNWEEVKNAHAAADRMLAKQKEFVLNWEIDTTKYEMITFNGYAAKYRQSDFSAQQVLYYDHAAPYTKQIPFYNTYVAMDSVTAPAYYIIPQAYTDVIDRMKLNGVLMKQLKKDTAIEVEVYYIDDVRSRNVPYESHFLHYGTKVHAGLQKINYYKGDYVVQVNQSCNRYIVESLEPVGGDSYFSWNFFDGILQQKEWFSDYVFEAKADSLLKTDASLKTGFDQKMKSDTAFANDHWSQLTYIYQHSQYMERTKDRYPVTRLDTKAILPLE